MEIRPLDSAADLAAELDLRRHAFGPLSPARRPAREASLRRSIEDGAILGAFDGGQLLGTARYHPMRQWWHGRSVPMAGVTGVQVAPEARGRGVGTAMMTALLDTMAGRGYPLSVLFPATAALYRKAGWEMAGGVHQTVLPAAALAALLPPDVAGGDSGPPKLRRATPADGAAIVGVKGLVHQELRHCGPNTRDPAELRDWLDDEDHFAYLADDGFLSYRWADGGAELAVEELIAVSAETARAFWQILASHASMASQVRVWLPPEDAVTWLTREPAAVTTRTETWMLRIIDAPAAFAGRGYPAGVSLSAVLDLSDPVRSANSGRWTLQVDGGAGRLERTGVAASAPGPAALSVGARGLAALYAGVPVSTLRLAGLTAGGPAAGDDALGAAFGGPAFLIDHF